MNVNEIFSKEELEGLLEKSDWRASWEVIFTWLFIGLNFTMVYLFPNVFTIIIAIILLGGRQVALAILMHDSSHNSLFKSKKTNDWIGQWLCAAPIFHHAGAYRTYHLQHHTFTGSKKDPDLPIVNSYPTTPMGFFRKTFRDLTGQTGIKAYVGIFMMHLGFLKYSLGGLVIKIDQQDRKSADILKAFYKNLTAPIITNLLLFLVLYTFASGWLYLIWIGALLTTNTFYLRVRALAEHGVTPDLHDPLLNTRTTKARFWERLLWAPHNVNYHLEHHLLMSVPCYNLPKMHRMLKEKGVYQNACYANSYTEVFKAAVNPSISTGNNLL